MPDTATATTPVKVIKGVTEAKKTKLDGWAIKVLDAKHNVDQFQAMVNSLTDKLNNFNGFLATADANRVTALANQNLVNQLVQNAKDLEHNSEVAWNEMTKADTKTQALAKKVKGIIHKLIYSAEVINKLSITVIRAKALNQLISDDLVSRIGKIGTDANNAVALALVALQSTFSAQASGLETMQAITLERDQSTAFHQMLTTPGTSIQVLIASAYTDAKTQYETCLADCVVVTNQLAEAQAKLNKAQVKLKSLQAGLNAAMAAALAS